MTISDQHLAWLDTRGISPDLADRFGLYTAEGALVFPFIEHGREVAAKYRAADKRFWQRAGGKRTFYNADILDDPALAQGQPLIITEGELDALTAAECGFPFVVSVPDGAPQGEAEEGPVDPEADKTGKFEFMFNNRDRLKRVKRFTIAVDNDAPGQRLAAELVRRLGASRCAFVTYPEGCKDLNDVLKARGPEGVAAVLNGARAYPVQGVYRLSDYPPTEAIRVLDTGWPALDGAFNAQRHLSLFAGCFEVVTGIPGHGKTTWAINRAIQAARLHGWRTAVFSPEMPTVPHLHNKMRRIASGRPMDYLMRDRDLRQETDRFLNNHFVFLDADPETGSDDLDHSLEWIIERTHDAVWRYGVQHLIVDPWNEVEHAKPQAETMPDYIGRGIRMLKRLAKERQLHVTVIVHPTKAVGQGEEPRIPTLYDCEGSAHWYNKPDLGVVVARDPENPMGTDTIIRVAKVRFDETGHRGDVRLRYDPESCRFEAPAAAHEEAGYGR